MAQPTAGPTPGPPSESVPSSFDSSPEFFEEKRLAKLSRRLREEPLIPLGCAATCYALYQASKSIRAGDHHQTNRMFRARIYAQGFTLLALVGGSIFWQDDRMKKKELERAIEEKKRMEKREKWLRELEQRDREDRDWRSRFEGVAMRAKQAEEGTKVRAGQAAEKAKVGFEAVAEGGKEGSEQGRKSIDRAEVKVEQAAKIAEEKAEAVADKAKEAAKQGKKGMSGAIEKSFQSKSVLEQVQDLGWGRGMWSAREAWRRR